MQNKRKLALVTGGSQGIGREICLSLAEAEFNIVLINRTKDEEAQWTCEKIRERGVDANYFLQDLTQLTKVQKLIKTIRNKIGPVDVLVNNAAIFDPKPIEKVTENDWDNQISLNLKVCFFLSQYVIPDMKKKRWGRIINISSIAGLGGFPNSAAYCASKGGLNNMTKSMCLELAKYGINVNAIAPGNIVTPMNEDLRKDTKWSQKMAERTPTGQDFLPAADVAGIVTFLSSEESNAIHGSIIPVDAGWRAW